MEHIVCQWCQGKGIKSLVFGYGTVYEQFSSDGKINDRFLTGDRRYVCSNGHEWFVDSTTKAISLMSVLSSSTP